MNVITQSDVDSLVSELREVAQDYHDSTITHEQMQSYNRMIWDAAERMGVSNRVVDALRSS